MCNITVLQVLILVLFSGLCSCLDESSTINCEPDSCPPTATCVDMGSYIYCECPHGKTGTNCTIDDPCLPQTDSCPPGKYCWGPCDPNVICEGATGEAHCRGCVVGWKGSACDEDINECTDIPDICANGGTCRNLVGDFWCKCTADWYGKECRCKIDEPCDDVVEQLYEQTTPANGQPTTVSPTHLFSILMYISMLLMT